ncbi:MtrAB system histidine kinase MtrB [Nonomuraea sp. NPDC050556]|uniref:MtrAB system histidine kinase MtrB n=1 Tax=Nonomuraea sp. NPDC050556 TaxID=3364369 RepID=UPI0037BC72C7
MPPKPRRRRTFRQILGGIRRRARRVAGKLRRTWRRSLQLQVITSTLLVSATVVAVLGVFLFQQINDTVVRGRTAAAIKDAKADKVQIMAILDEPLGTTKTEGGKDAARPALDRAIEAVTGSDQSDWDRSYEVMILNPTEPGQSQASGSITPADIPEGLRRDLEVKHQHNQLNVISHWRTLLNVPGESKPQLTLVTGVFAQSYGPIREIYHFFPLTAEEETLYSVRGILVVVGAGLVLLLVAIAFLVTRQVVTPVRLARQAAERLASGRLDERLKVRGEDDLARLATSFNEMAANLALKIHQLEELSHVQRQFVSDVSHELRTPLTTVRMAADLLYDAREDFDPMASRSAELMQAQLERFESMLADLLEISRYDAGAATLDLDSTDIRDVVLRAVGDSEALAERHGTRFELRLPNEPCLAEVDSRRVERILRNLLFNAIEHGEGRDIVVTVGADRDAVAVAVRDHGVGLKPGEETMVFDRFWRADPSRARTIGGTGLGLAISREDAMLHGGWLQAWGSPGDGSQFRLSLPRLAGSELKGSPLPLVPPEVEMRRTWRGHITPVLSPATGDEVAHAE